MKPITAQTLKTLQAQNRSMLLFSILFFLIALFALVSHWPAAYLLIVLSCFFHLVSRKMAKRRYARALVEALVESAIKPPLRADSYAHAESADGLLQRLGLIPPLPCVPGAKAHHVLHGVWGNHSFSIGETALVRKQGTALRSAGGTFVAVEGVLPLTERWILHYRHPFSSISSDQEYAQAGYRPSSRESTPLLEDYTLWQHRQGCCKLVDACMASMQKEMDSAPAALAAKDGSLALFIEGVYYSPNRIDSSAPFSPAMLEGFHLPALDIMQSLVNSIPHD